MWRCPQQSCRIQCHTCAMRCMTRCRPSHTCLLRKTSRWRSPQLRSVLQHIACTARYPPTRHVPWHNRHRCRRRPVRAGPPCTASLSTCRRMRGPQGTRHTHDWTTHLVQPSRIRQLRKHADHGKRGRWCSSEPRTCTDPPGTEPGASSTRGSMSPSASSTPTRWSCTSSQRSKARRRSRPTSSWRPRTPSTRDPSSTCPPSSGPGPRGTCATRCTPAQTSRRPRRTCRTRTGCTTRSPPSRTILRCRWSTRRSRLRRRSRRCTASPWRCHRKSGLPGRPSTRG